MTDNSPADSQTTTVDSIWHYFTDGASLTAGLGGRSISVEVRRIGTNDRGELVSDTPDAFFFSYNLKPSYFKDSNFGYNWMFNLSTFHATKQNTGAETPLDMGTQLGGFFAYAVPAFYYNWGNKYSGDHFRAGIGFGLGLANFEGDIILTESSTNNDRINIHYAESDLIVAIGIFFEWQWGYFTMRLSTAGPALDYDGYEINISDSSLMLLGFTYALD